MSMNDKVTDTERLARQSGITDDEADARKERILAALKPGHGLPEPQRFSRLRDMPAGELAHRVVGSLIREKGNLNGYAKVIEALIVNMRAEYAQAFPEWTLAGAPPPLARNGVSEWVLATDGEGQVAMRFYRHAQHYETDRWGGIERGYLWNITHWMPCPPKPVKDSITKET